MTKRFDGKVAVDGLSLDIQDGEFFTLLGPSGCGKSTTLSMIAGMIRPDSGAIKAGEQTFFDSASRQFIPPESRNLGMVFQGYALWPHMTVRENLALPLRLRKKGKSERNALIDDALRKVGLDHLSERFPHQLSGGQQQRVALARAIVYSPSVLLLDEPLSNLDAQLRNQARLWIKRLQRDVGTTTLYVTHDQTEALALSDRIAMIIDGRIAQIGTPREIYERPVSEEVAAFIGRCNFFEASVDSVDPDANLATVHIEGLSTPLTVHTNGSFSIGSDVTLAIKSERLQIHEASSGPRDNVLSAHILSASYVGSGYEYELSVQGSVIWVQSTTKVVGAECNISIPADGCVLFAKDSSTPVVSMAH